MAILLRDDEDFHQQCPHSYLAEMAERHGVQLAVVESADALRSALADVDIFVGSEVPPDLPSMPPKLAWIHAPSAGVENLMVPAIRNSNIRVTNSAGTMAPEVAEHVLALILMHTRRVDCAVVAQRDRRWATILRDNPPLSLAGLVIGIVGYGHLGRAVATYTHMLGATAIGLDRHPKEPDGLAEEILGRERFHELLGRSDIVVSVLPGVADARGMFDLDAFRAMKATAYFVSVGRGTVVDEVALAQALSEGLIAGAACDVFVNEPLPPKSPLWDAPNFLVTPHIAGCSQHVWKRIIDLLFDNVERWRRGAPLLNEVDKASNY